jgi:hypothetical protein
LAPKFLEMLGLLEDTSIPVVEDQPRVGLGAVVRAACRVSVIMTDQVSNFEAFFRVSRDVFSAVISLTPC